MRVFKNVQGSSVAGREAILPSVGSKSQKSGDVNRRRVNSSYDDAGSDSQILRRPNNRGSEFERNLIRSGFVKPGGGVYIAAFIRFIHLLAPEYHAVDRKTIRRWLDGEDNAVAAALVRVIQFPNTEIERMIYDACRWGGRD